MPTSQLAVVGHPIAHSQSPALHRAAYRSLELDWTYDAQDVEPGGLGVFVSGLGPEWRGLSVTMPHKAEALSLATDADLLATLTGGANTLVFETLASGQRAIHAYNTDVAGIVNTLHEVELGVVRHVAIAGGGVTAASAIVAAAELGAEWVTVLVRNPDRAQSLTTVAEGAGVVLRVASFDDLSAVAPADLVISTLPGSVEVSLAHLARTASAVLLDVAYSPWPSIRGAEWATTGGTVVSGARMLAHQALVQVRLFVGLDAHAELPHEAQVRHAMFESINLQP
jgi:shikimate dehydrogenase